MSRPNPEQEFSDFIEVYRQGTPSGVSQTLYPIDPIRKRYREYSSVRTPGYPRVKQTNPYSMFFSEHRKRSYLVMRRDSIPDPGYWDEITYIYRSPTFTVPLSFGDSPGECFHIPGVNDRAIGRAIDQVKDMKINFAQAVAERRQVERSMVDIVKRLTLAAEAIRRKDFEVASRALGYNAGWYRRNIKPQKSVSFANRKAAADARVQSKQFAQDWLAFQYGWKPLLSDVQGLAEKLAQSHLQRPFYVDGRGSAKVARSSDLAKASNVNSLGADVDWKETSYYTSSRCFLRFKVDNEFARLGSETGISDPALLAWELLPYSFVVDWFYPVGTFLSRLSYDSGLQFLYGFCTTKSERYTEVAVRASDFTSGSLRCHQTGGTALSSYGIRVQRDVFTAPPRPVLPKLKDPYSPTHLMNALSLFRVAMRR